MKTIPRLSNDLMDGKRPITEHIHEIQSHLVNITLLIGAVISVPALIASCFHATEFGWNTIVFVQIGCAALVWVSTLWRHRWSLRTRILFMLLITSLLGTGGLMTYGLIGGDWFWFLLGSMLATVFLGLRYGFAYLAGSLAIMVLIGTGICLKALAIDLNHEAFVLAPSSWIVLIFGGLVFLFAILMPIGILQKGLMDALGIVHQQALDLRTANDRLQEEIHERRQADEHLRESQERYRTLAEASPDSIYMFDTSGAFRFVNEPGARMVGRTPEEMIGLRQEDVFPPEQAQQHTTTVQHVLNTGESMAVEGWVSLPDGEHWFDTRIVPVKGADGKPAAILGISRDITERKLAEKRLQESQERYALAEKAAKIGVWDWNMLTDQLQWSVSIEPVFGFKPGEFHGTIDAFYECVHPEDRKHVRDAVQATLERQEEYNTEHRIVWPDGTVRWLQEKGDVYRDEQGQPTRMLGVVLDITHRKSLENALLESEERFRAIADYTYDWEEWIGPDGRPLWINPGGERLIGYTREECLAMPGYPLALIHEEDRPLADRYFREALEGSSENNIPLRICRKDGSLVHTLVSWQPIHDRQGRFLGCRSSIRDVTELRRVEADRARLREQLHNAQKMEAVGKLASGIAHDFQNLLAVIKIHADLLGRAVAGQDAAVELLQVIREVAEQAKGMVQSLLMLSRAVPVEKKPVELTRVVHNFSNMLRTTLPASIDVVNEFEPDSPAWISADVTELQQILMNLALNARDAMPEGGCLRIAVSSVPAVEMPDRLAPDTSNSSWACIKVSDNGRGIPAEIRSRIFEPFFSTKPRDKGTGLGLAVVHGIVEDHEGSMHVDSHVNSGTTFTIYLPQLESEEVSAEFPSIASISTESSGIILLAEDNWYLGNEIASLLRYTGHRVIRAEDGVSLLEEVRQYRGKVCLLVLDSDLPENGGYEVLRHLREAGDDTPAVILTDLDETTEQGAPDDNTILLRKPFAQEELIRLIDKLLHHDTSHPELL
ncbi:MAG: PAS domain S-box protein [Phycisphaerales bacterium]|nr:PAS domain S-box protein [Phycisphaerales bacterium]